MFRARGHDAAPAHERRAAGALRRAAWPSISRACSSRWTPQTSALYETMRGVNALATVGRGIAAAATRRTDACRSWRAATLHRAELPRAAAPDRARESRSAWTASRFSPRTCRRPPSADASRRRLRTPDCGRARGVAVALTPTRSRSSARSSSGRSRSTSRDFESGFVAESPDSCGAWRSITRRSAATDRSPVRVQCTLVSVVLEADGRRAPCFFHAVGRQHPPAPLADLVDAQPARVPSTLDVDSDPTGAPLRLLAERRLETITMDVDAMLRDTQQALRRRRGRTTTDRTRRTASCRRCAIACGRRSNAFVPPGSRILDLGCGPGADAEYFARRGDRVRRHRLVAGDGGARQSGASRRPPRRSRGRAALGIHEIDRLDAAAFDAVCSNFGPLNCVHRSGSGDARRSPAGCGPSGVVVASVIGRICPWELALYSGARRLAACHRSLRAGIRRRCRLPAAPSGPAITRTIEFESICAFAAWSRGSTSRARTVRAAAVSPGLRRSPSDAGLDTRNASTTRLAPGRWPGGGAITF